MADALSTEPSSGRDRWYEKSPSTPLDRFPVLGDAMVAAAKAWTESFCALSASPGELAFTGLLATNAAEAKHLSDDRPMLASFRVPSWDGMACLVLGRSLVLAFVEALFGGDGQADAGSAGRPASPVELRMVDVIGGQAATALTAGFREFSPTRFEFDRTRAYPDTRFLGKPDAAMLAAGFELKAIGRSIPFQLVLPLMAVENHAAVWSSSPSTAPLIDETMWASQLRAEVGRAALALRASIVVGPVTLGDIVGWKVGDTVELPPSSNTNVLLSCEKEALFVCDLGQSMGMYTVRIGEPASSGAQPPRKDE